MRKRASAMRSLLNLGWIVIIILALIGALTYFNIITPEFFLRDKCKMTEELRCIDYKADRNGVELTIRNDLGYEMDNVSVSISGERCSEESSEEPVLEEGQIGIYSFPCALSRGKLKADVSITYINNRTNASITKNGELVVSVR